MKHTLLLIAIALLFGIQTYAQPTTITWQGKLLDADGNAITRKYTENLMNSGKVRSVVMKTIGFLSGIPTIEMFVDAFGNIGGSTETYLFNAKKSESL
ncbi:MAG: hypothetical protein K9H16_12265 [Bacteroidales bacterium]|nr:hypothetical protein [Bacteroidales bacterium]